MAVYLKNVFRLTIISILLKRDLTSYNIYYDRVPILGVINLLIITTPSSVIIKELGISYYRQIPSSLL